MARDEVTVRMYRGILGDCFLIRHDSDGGSWWGLVDCGVLQGVAGGRDRIRRIAADVRDACGGILDLAVLTHEHADHLSGFGHAAEIFFGEGMTIHRLWLAWTENDQDEQAQALRQKFDKSNNALALAVGLRDHGFGKDERLARIAGLQGFVSFETDEPAVAVAAAPAAPATPEAAPVPAQFKGPWSGKRVIEALKAKAGTGNIDYLEPGEIRAAGIDGRLRAYVLGPPRDIDRLKKDLPSKGAAKEVYLAGMNEALAVASGANAVISRLPTDSREAATVAGSDPPDPSPFARPHWRAFDGVRTRRPHHKGVERLYFSGASERRIEDDWLDAAEALALKMDSDTNNTSLVLAFELPDRQVLLFAADAQVGNWLSWSDQTYPREAVAGEPAPIVVDDLLNRVTLYKVGHHASHNATLRDRGLERMTDPRLTAMIPVVEAVAKLQGKGWRMPYPDLEDRLLEKTGNRVLRGDDDNIAREMGAFADWPHAALAYQQAEGGGLWVEVTIPASL